MHLDPLLPAFAGFPDILEHTVSCWPVDEVGLRPGRDDWSVLEICVHLLDEEREDFRPRLLSTVEDPGREWAAIDPEGWVTVRGYADRELGEVLAAFREERGRSVQTLRGLGDVDWHRSHDHPALGAIAAGDLLSAWLAHDWLHLRQLARRSFERVLRGTAPFDARYAGPPQDWAPARG